MILAIRKDCNQIVFVGDSSQFTFLKSTPLLISKGLHHLLPDRLGITPIVLETNPKVLRKLMDLSHLNIKNRNLGKDRAFLYYSCSLLNIENIEEKSPRNDNLEHKM
jgi:hypothetical protein